MASYAHLIWQGVVNGAWQVVFSTHKLMYVFYETLIFVMAGEEYIIKGYNLKRNWGTIDNETNKMISH